MVLRGRPYGSEAAIGLFGDGGQGTALHSLDGSKRKNNGGAKDQVICTPYIILSDRLIVQYF